MRRAVCVKCNTEMRPLKNGQPVLETKPSNYGDGYEPYKLWMGDKWGCQSCGTEIVIGFGSEPIAEHFESDFSDTVRKYDEVDGVVTCN